MTKLSKSVLEFLREIKIHNNRDWYQKHKTTYESAKKSVEEFIDEVILEMNQYDFIETPSGRKSLRRIYRDLRFASDKSPYKTYFAGRLQRATVKRRGGYYFHFEAGNSYLAGGFYGPVAEDLRRIRSEIESDPDNFTKIISTKSFRNTFGTIQGEKLKSAPRGFVNQGGRP